MTPTPPPFAPVPFEGAFSAFGTAGRR